ncbi:hypothetical protein DCCM_2317 [Desulfocucumis palustris]|uniref:Uncharacterized protein n=1 Tax=Desulfocucumis palustris TaxID=1898651 RepID=A0A2L2XAL5_9FIRM|nr:hypothetical protein DCCM_2317 [Desulfocucumis palustris]
MPFGFRLDRKRTLLTAGAAAASLLFVLVWGVISLLGTAKVVPEELFNHSLQNTLTSHSYRYSVEVKQNGSDVISTVQGERVEPDRVHIKGAMLKSRDIEFIQISDVTYMKDPWSSRWITLEDSKLAQAELFLTEFNPLSMFNFKDVPEVKVSGSERVDGVKTVLMELKPSVSNPYLEFKYVDYDYKIWADPKDQLIRKAVLEANLPAGQKGMTVEMKFWDFNEPLIIEKPGIETGS